MKEKKKCKIKRLKRMLPFICATLLLLGSSMNVFATSSVYHLPSDINEKANEILGTTEYNYLIFKMNDMYYIEICSASSTFFYSTMSHCLCSNTGKYLYYSSENGSEWGEVMGLSSTPSIHRVGIIENSGAIPKDIEIVCSNVDVHKVYSKYNELISNESIIENSEGLFFQRPPMPIAEMAIPLAGAVQNQTQMILPIVIGCLALLVGLTILAKKLRIFL